MTSADTSIAPAFAQLTRDTVLLTGADVVPFLQTKLTCDTRTWAAEGGG